MTLWLPIGYDPVTLQSPTRRAYSWWHVVCQNDLRLLMPLFSCEYETALKLTTGARALNGRKLPPDLL